MSETDPILEMYIYESTQMIEQTEAVILDCELASSFSLQSINEIFRNMHTLKGSSAMMQFMNIADTAHAVEDLFHVLREQQPTSLDYRALSDLVLQSVDFFKSEIIKVSQHLPVDGNAEHLVRDIQFFLATMIQPLEREQILQENAPHSDVKQESTHKRDPDIGNVTTSINTDHSNAELQSQDNHSAGYVYHAVIHFYEDCAMENVRAYQLVHHLSEVASRMTYQPERLLEDEESAGHIRDRGFHLIMKCNEDYASMHELLMKTSYLLTLELFQLEAWPEELSDASAASEPQHNEEDIPISKAVPTHNEELLQSNAAAHGCDSTILPESLQQFGSPPSSYEENLAASSNGVLHVNVSPSEEALSVHAASRPGASAAGSSKDSNLPLSQGTGRETGNDILQDSSSVRAVMQPSKAVSSPMISVHVEKLDRLMDLVGELVIAEAMIHNSEDMHTDAEDSPLYKATSQLRKITSELQDTAMSIRMIPLTATFHKMRRVSRDMSRKLQKEIEFVIIGEETEIDKTVIDQISDPLMHLVRNAIDHGIEEADQRKAANKSAFGTIVLEAQNVGSDVLVIVKDDGKGLHREKILEKAIKQGMISADESDMTDRDVFNLIFQPGLSTQEQITEFSGRGVGMDVVASNIQQVGGVIYIDSEAGKGTTVTMKIPLTLAIIDGMNVRVGQQNYTIPINAITESFRPQSKDLLVDPDGNPMIMVRGDCYPILSLHERYYGKREQLDYTKGILIMTEQDGIKICIFVDELLGQQQVVIKPLPQYLRQFSHKNNGLAGCTLLGDGSISLILNMAELTGVNHHAAS